MSSSIKTIAVVGTGVIGSSWTALFLAHGYKVLVADPAPKADEKLKDYLNFIWPQIPKNENADLANYSFMGGKIPDDDLAKVDFVQENGPERLELKIDLLGSLDAATRPHVPICSSTSGLVPSSFIAKCQQAPNRVLVAHPWNPPHLMPLVELVPHPSTSAEVVEVARKFFLAVGKKPIVLRKEAPGFVGNRLQAAVSREAFNLVASGVCDPEAVEQAMLDALGPRWALTGPFMTSILGAGGNPGGYVRMQEHLGPAFASWVRDMDKVATEVGNDRAQLLQSVREKVDKRIGQVNTRDLEKERNEVMQAFFRLREATEVLSKYAAKD